MDGNPEDDNFDFWVPGNEDRNELEESKNESLSEFEHEMNENVQFLVINPLPVNFRYRI